jgi:fido (protein-threonine AMPylation protein)
MAIPTSNNEAEGRTHPSTVVDQPWYEKYDVIRGDLERRHEELLERCDVLGIDPNRVLSDFWQDIVIHAVRESNWQEGICLDRGKTQELADQAFDEVEYIQGPHLDMNKILRFHREAVVKLRRRGASVEEIAALNLARAYIAVTWVGKELRNREAATWLQGVDSVRECAPEYSERFPGQDWAKVEKGFKAMERRFQSEVAIDFPLSRPIQNEGALIEQLVRVDSQELLKPMKVDYIHFFHRLVLMGLARYPKTGRFRSTSVHVGNPDLLFPPASAVEKLMVEFCDSFPTIQPTLVTYDPVIEAAKASHRFVKIHPYVDGNGRVSRLVMNLVLWNHFPPVYLKADKKGRHRYAQALRRADRGNFKPLAALIATFLVEIYSKMLAALRP